MMNVGKQNKLEKLISLTFDNNPNIRKKAAEELATYDDPAALLALLELMGDKDKSVSNVAKQIIDKKKEEDPEIKPITELFEGLDLSGGKKEEIKKKMSEPLEQIFSKHIGKERAKEIVPKIMEAYDTNKIHLAITEYLGTVGSANEEDEINSDDLARESEMIEHDEYFTIEEKKVLEFTGSLFKSLYDYMLLSGDVKALDSQKKKLIKFLTDQVNAAYKLAKKKFKAVKLTDISNIKDGMRNITTDELRVKIVEHKVYNKTKTKRELYTRVVLVDEEGKEGVLYLFDSRGRYIKPGMKIRVEKGKAKTFKFSNETALTVDKRGKIVAEF